MIQILWVDYWCRRRTFFSRQMGKKLLWASRPPSLVRLPCFWVVLLLTCMDAQGSITSTPTGTKYIHILTLISSQISPWHRSWCTLVGLCGRGRRRWNDLQALQTEEPCSIVPCLALRGVAKGIAKSYSLKAKVLLRESQASHTLSGLFVNTIDSELQE